MHSYLNDIVAGAALVTLVNLLLGLSPYRHNGFGIIWGVALPLSAGLFWEYVAPIYAGGTSDPLDLVAYLGGGIAVWLVLRLRTFAMTPPLLPRHLHSSSVSLLHAGVTTKTERVLEKLRMLRAVSARTTTQSVSGLTTPTPEQRVLFDKLGVPVPEWKDVAT